MTAAAWRGRHGARTTSHGGGNNYLSFRIEGPAADQSVEALKGFRA